MQLIAGRTAQEYNQRRAMQGAFWEDRYHATAIEIDEHLHRCVVYIDLNMARAGVVNHPVRRDTVVRPVDNSRKRGEPLPAARLDSFAYFPKTKFIRAITSGGCVTTSRAKASSLSPPTGSGFQPRFSASNPYSIP
jgi:hypothetical protein